MTGQHARRSETIEQQELHSDAVIFWFDDFEGEQPFRFLSNFYRGMPLAEPDLGYQWPTGEHMFAGYKATNRWDRERILLAVTPDDAKAIGRSINLRPNWEEIKYDVMRLVLRIKFTLEREEGQLLLETGDRLLVEGTWWNDRTWGVDLKGAPTGRPWGGQGRNWLGALLMARRAGLRAAQAHGVVTDYSAVRLFSRGRKV